MFRRSTILSSSLFCILSLLWLSYLSLRPTSTSTEQKQDPRASFILSEQIRHNVCKDIWIADPLGQRLHHRIESERSLISFNPHGASIEVLEHLFGVRCWIQEKNATTKQIQQQFRFIVAEEGLYNYRDQSFKAQDVIVSMYKIPGTIFPKSLASYSPFLQGNAESITLTLQNGAPKFAASHFKASLKDNKSL